MRSPRTIVTITVIIAVTTIRGTITIAIDSWQPLEAVPPVNAAVGWAGLFRLPAVRAREIKRLPDHLVVDDFRHLDHQLLPSDGRGQFDDQLV